MKFPRILVKAPNWLGDAVMAGPFINALRNHWKGAYLAVLPSGCHAIWRVQFIGIMDQ